MISSIVIRHILDGMLTIMTVGMWRLKLLCTTH